MGHVGQSSLLCVPHLLCRAPSHTHTHSTTSTQMALPPHLYVKRSSSSDVRSAANLESWPPYVGPPLWAHRLQRFHDIVTTDMTSAERAGLAEQFMRGTAGKRTQCGFFIMVPKVQQRVGPGRAHCGVAQPAPHHRLRRGGFEVL